MTALLALCALSNALRADESPKPNILMIVSDDQGWADIGYNGSEIDTPHLDRLAETGVRLDRHYVFPTCSPTRAALLTGRNPSRFKIHGPIGGRSKHALPKQTVTLADALGAAGYFTAISGKWHLGLRPEVGPKQYGFESSYGYLHGQIDQHTHRYKNGDRTWHRQDTFVDEPGHATDLITDEAVRVIEQQRDRPFFLYVTYSVPHFPLQEADEWISKYDGRIPNTDRKQFAASVTHMDAAIGRMIRALDDSGKRKSTLIIFTSDNGGQKEWRPGSQYEGKHGPNLVLGSNHPLRGWKGQVYEGGVRVPALVNWPGRLKPGVVQETISAMDWFPTLASLCGFEADVAWKLEGLDAWPLISGVAVAAFPNRTLYWNTGSHFAVLRDKWKLIERSREQSPAYELFNLLEDPFEKQNLIDQPNGRLEELKQALDAQKQLDR